MITSRNYARKGSVKGAVLEAGSDAARGEDALGALRSDGAIGRSGPGLQGSSRGLRPAGAGQGWSLCREEEGGLRPSQGHGPGGRGCRAGSEPRRGRHRELFSERPSDRRPFLGLDSHRKRRRYNTILNTGLLL